MDRKVRHNHALTTDWQPQEDCPACQLIARGQARRRMPRYELSPEVKAEIAALPPLTEQVRQELRVLLRPFPQPSRSKEAA